MEDLDCAVVGGRGEEGVGWVELDGADGTGMVSFDDATLVDGVSRCKWKFKLELTLGPCKAYC